MFVLPCPPKSPSQHPRTQSTSIHLELILLHIPALPEALACPHRGLLRAAAHEQLYEHTGEQNERREPANAQPDREHREDAETVLAHAVQVPEEDRAGADCGLVVVVVVVVVVIVGAVEYAAREGFFRCNSESCAQGRGKRGEKGAAVVGGVVAFPIV
jgi:hypothetical protein